MKKIPTLFKREFEGHNIVKITDEITPGCEEAFYKGVATVKYDGACCAIIDGTFYKRYDAKKGKKPPEGAVPCCDPDPITGHWPHWIKVDPTKPEDKWFVQAYNNTNPEYLKGKEGTFEAIGPHFQGNPSGLGRDSIIRHGDIIVRVTRTFEGVKEWLSKNYRDEGLVFWLNGEPVCKIKRSDFGLPWNKKETK